jgi:peptidoglycan L-alanyl-D-glutamate endopeptidase CwlK
MYSAITPELVAQVFPATPLHNISTNLPAILTELAASQCDRNMLIMALATIRAETESFIPLKEFISHYNTPPGGPPYSLYDNRADLGNHLPGDGAKFCGRGYVQLTGRSNYTSIGTLIKVDLVDNPELACDSNIAAKILVAFLMRAQKPIEAALQKQPPDLAAARKLVNGGTNGLDRFTDAFNRANAAFPQTV